MGTMRWSWLAAVVGFASIGTGRAAEPLRLDVTRDTWLSAVGKEADGNNGGSPRLKTKGIQEFALIDIDPKPLAGRVVKSATLHLRAESKDPQRRVTVSTIATDWVEGTGTGYAVQKGSASFRFAAQDERPWSLPNGDITTVINGVGNTLWGFAEATPPDKDGWQTVAIDPRVLAARGAGISFGLVVFDDVGNEYTRDGEKFQFRPFVNRLVSSKDSNRARAPYLTVELGEADREKPAAADALKIAVRDLPPGEALISWPTPADAGPAGTLGFLARYSPGDTFDPATARPVPQYLVPLARKPGQTVSMHLRDLGLAPGQPIALEIRAIDAAGNASDPFGGPVKLSNAPARAALQDAPVKPFDKPAAAPTIAGVSVCVLDALDKAHPVTGQLIPAHDVAYLTANHLWSAADKTIRLHAARNEHVDFQLLLTGQANGISATLTFPGAAPAAPRGELFRFRHVESKLGPLPDPLLPLTGPIDLPAADEKIAGQKHAALIGEIYVPHDAAPGDHAGTLTIKVGDATLTLNVTLHVWDFTLPDHLSFLSEMNCYSLPAPPADTAYYRLAHAHRTILNRLGYNWRGGVDPHCAPTWKDGQYNWSTFDAHFAPLLTGAAFADLPRKGVPVEKLYLPINENWPIPINPHFKGGYWIEDALDAEYPKLFADACAKFAAHLSERQWHDTFFEFYLNNKVYYKKDAWSRSSAPWIFDEPVNTQDFWALRYYGKLFHGATAPVRGKVKLAFRCDVSRPEWQRDLLDGLLDVNIVGGSFRQYNRTVLDRKHRNTEIAYNYGSSNRIEQANVQPVGWSLDTWCLGGDGVLPWQTVGTDKSWAAADELSLFYPGKAVGLPDPVASVRLKAYRRGQQDVEYLVMLAQTTNTPRFALARTVRESLGLAATLDKKSEADAGLVAYGNLTGAQLWALRMRLAATLEAAKPPVKKRWVTFETPARDVAALPDIRVVGAPAK